MAGGVFESLIQQLPSEQLVPATEQEDLVVALSRYSALLQILVVSVPRLHSWRQTGLLGSGASVTVGEGLDWFPSSWHLIQRGKAHMELQSSKNALLKPSRKEYTFKSDSGVHE